MACAPLAIDWSVNDLPAKRSGGPDSVKPQSISRHNGPVQDAFAIVLVVVLVGAVIAAIWASVGTAEAYRQIGRGGLSLNDGADRPAQAPTRAVAAGEREAEIRQMLEARGRRRAARGLPPV